jgi:hypothetical protein
MENEFSGLGWKCRVAEFYPGFGDLRSHFGRVAFQCCYPARQRPNAVVIVEMVTAEKRLFFSDLHILLRWFYSLWIDCCRGGADL